MAREDLEGSHFEELGKPCSGQRNGQLQSLSGLLLQGEKEGSVAGARPHGNVLHLVARVGTRSSFSGVTVS